MRYVLISVLVLLCQCLWAQELWLTASRFLYKTGETAQWQVLTGENRASQPYAVQPALLDKFELHQGATVVSLKEGVKGTEVGKFAAPLASEGTVMVVLKTKGETVEKELEAFQAYLKEYDLEDPSLATSPVKETFRRYARLLLQVGASPTDVYKKPADFALEIVPEKNPYSLKQGEQMRFKILWQGKPLFGARVKVWNTFQQRTMIQNIYTEKDGTLQAPISNKGTWMVSVMYRTPARDGKSEGTTFCSSLVFGLDE